MFYGWILLIFLWVFGVLSGAGSAITWGFFAKEVIEELGLTAADIGAVSGVAVITYSVTAPIAGILMARFGCRLIMPVGFLIAATGCAVIAVSSHLWSFFIGFSVLLSGGGLLHSVLPSQTLITNWFDKYRARVLAISSTSLAVTGFVWIRIHNEIEQAADWRTGWWVATGINLALALFAPVLIRNSPESMGHHPDGASTGILTTTTKPVSRTPRPQRSAIWAAIRTPQFALLVLLSVAAVAPNGLVLVHGRLHLESVGLTQDQAVGVLSISALIAVLGRLASSAGDFIPPVRVLLVALALEAAGTAGLIFAANEAVAYLSVAAMGVGFGAGFQTITILMGRFFGREIFSATQGSRTAAAGAFNATIPWAVGLSADLTGSYSLALSAEAGALIGLVILSVFLLKPPGIANA